MEVRIQSIHFDASEQLQAFVQKKAVKLEKYYDDIKKVEVSLKVVKPETAENKEAGKKVIIPPHNMLFTFYHCIQILFIPLYITEVDKQIDRTCLL